MNRCPGDWIRGSDEEDESFNDRDRETGVVFVRSGDCCAQLFLTSSNFPVLVQLRASRGQGHRAADPLLMLVTGCGSGWSDGGDDDRRTKRRPADQDKSQSLSRRLESETRIRHPLHLRLCFAACGVLHNTTGLLPDHVLCPTPLPDPALI